MAPVPPPLAAPVTRHRATPTSRFQENNNNIIISSHKVRPRLALGLLFLRPLFSQLTFVNDPTQTLTTRQRRHIPNPPPLLHPSQLLPSLHNLSMPRKGVITLSPQPHSARDFLSHLGLSSSFVRHFHQRSFARPTIIVMTHSPWCPRLVLRPGMNPVDRIALEYLCRQTDI